jgi:hypothetical protein
MADGRPCAGRGREGSGPGPRQSCAHRARRAPGDPSRALPTWPARRIPRTTRHRRPAMASCRCREGDRDDTSRSSRTGLPVVGASCGSAPTVTVPGGTCAVTCSTMSARSTKERSVTSGSERASSSSPPSSRSWRVLTSSSVSPSWRSSGEAARRCIATSSSARLRASGVRSSWEALAMKRRWPSKAWSRRASMTSKVSASSQPKPTAAAPTTASAIPP